VAFSQLLPSDFILRAVANAQQTRRPRRRRAVPGWAARTRAAITSAKWRANDIGWRLSLEAYSPDFGTWFGKSWHARALVFADAARGHDSDPPQNPDNKLGSFGVGVRANEGKSLAFRLDVARVTQDAGTRQAGDWRAHFAAAYSY
jgi:hypothetical protein